MFRIGRNMKHLVPRPCAYALGSALTCNKLVPRRRIELPTPAFSGPRSTTELPRQNYIGESSEAIPAVTYLKGVGGELPRQNL